MNQTSTTNFNIVSDSFTWPRDVLRMPKDLPRRGAHHLLCFLACPFDLPDKADDLLFIIQFVCDEIGRYVGADIECVRADKISKPGTIHSDIWVTQDGYKRIMKDVPAD